MAKDFDFVFDLGKFTGTKTYLHEVIEECAAARPPPLLPDEFARTLASKSFTSKKADEAMVAGLYAKVFAEQMGGADELRYQRLQWGDDEVAYYARPEAAWPGKDLSEWP